MFGVTKRRLILFAIPIIAVLGISQTEIPSGGLDILNSAGDAVIQLFDTGDVEITGTINADVYEQDGVEYDLSSMGAGAKHTIKDEGTSRTSRTNLNFIGSTVSATDNSGTDSTDVTINAVAGPSSSTDNTLPRFDSTTGKLLQISGIVIDDSDNMSGVESLDLVDPLDVADGGTGVSTLADAGVLIGNGTGNIQVTGAGTSGQVLTSNGTGVDPTFQSFPGGGDALTTNPLDQFADTTSAQLAGIITNETGTGLLVFGTSPTLVTPNLGTPSAVNLANATGLTVAGGGTGATTFTDAGVLIGNSTGAVQSTGAGTAGQVLTSNGTGVDPTFQDAAGGGDVTGPGTSTDRAIATYNGTGGDTLRDNTVSIDASGNVTLESGDTVDGRDVSEDGAKLDGIETGATADQSDAEIATAYGNQVAAASQAEMEAGTETGVRRMTPQRVAQAIAALETPGDPTYGSEAGADADAVYVSADNWLGLGITDPLAPLHIYSATSAPRVVMQYYNDDAGDVTQYPTGASGTSWGSPGNVTANDATPATYLTFAAPINSNYIEAVFDFDIPTGAYVLGVEVDVEANATGIVNALNAYLIRDGTIDTSVNKASGTAIDGTPTVYTYGGPTDDWGGITHTEVNATDFGFAFRCEFETNGTIGIDYITITIYYTLGTSGDYAWSSGIDITDGAFTVRTDTDLFRIGTDGAVEFTGDVTANAFIGDGSGLTGLPSSGIPTESSSTDNAIVRWDGTGGDAVQNSEVTISDGGSITLGSGDTVDGRDLSEDGAKLDGIASGATANTGTVTSAAISGTDGIEVDSGSPITTSGTFTLGINAATLFAHFVTVASTTTPIGTDTIIYNDGGTIAEALISNFVLAPSSTDNRLTRFDGTEGQIQSSGITIDDSNNVSGLGTLNSHTIPSGSDSLVTVDAVQRLTGKAVQPRIGGTTSTPVTVNADDYDAYTVTLTGDTIISAPTGSYIGVGQLLLYRINQAATPYTVTWNSVFKSGADWALSGAIPAMSTTNDAWDFFLFMYNDSESEWQLLACSQGN